MKPASGYQWVIAKLPVVYMVLALSLDFTCVTGASDTPFECHKNSDCSNANALCNFTSMMCECDLGYVGNGSTCEKEECGVGIYCSDHAFCSNETGTPSCVCKEGFDGDGLTHCLAPGGCRDKSDCDPNADCVSDMCVCNTKYSGNGTVCEKIPCQVAPELVYCDDNADCSDPFSATPCACNPDFPVGDGTTYCLPLGECKYASDCDENASCSPSGVCECNDKYVGNGTLCAREQCGEQVCDFNAHCNADVSECVCNDDTPVGDGRYCLRIGECTVESDCTDFLGSHATCQANGLCKCLRGFHEVDGICQDQCVEPLSAKVLVGLDVGSGVPKYFYHPRQGKCLSVEVQEDYQNAGFVDLTACENWCMGKIKKLEVKKGPDMECVPSLPVLSRWFFNKETSKCEEFIFRGVEGNANQFLSENECKARTKSGLGLYDLACTYRDYDMYANCDERFAADGRKCAVYQRQESGCLYSDCRCYDNIEPVDCYEGDKDSVPVTVETSFECSAVDSETVTEFSVTHPKCRQRSKCESLEGAAAGLICPKKAHCEDIDTTMGASYHCVCDPLYEKVVGEDTTDETTDFECKPKAQPCEGENAFNVTINEVEYCLKRDCDKKSFCDAQLDCMSSGGWLLEKPSSVPISELYRNIEDLYDSSPEPILWFGLNDLTGSDVAQLTSGNPEINQVAQFENTRLDRRCMVLTGGDSYSMESCEAEHCYICQKPTYPRKCPANWMPQNEDEEGGCFFFSDQIALTHSRAASYCESVGAELATLTEDNFNFFLNFLFLPDLSIKPIWFSGVTCPEGLQNGKCELYANDEPVDPAVEPDHPYVLNLEEYFSGEKNFEYGYGVTFTRVDGSFNLELITTERAFFCQMNQPSLQSGSFKPCTCGSRAYARHGKCYHFLPSFDDKCGSVSALKDALISDTIVEELITYMRSEIVAVFQSANFKVKNLDDVAKKQPDAVYISGQDDFGDKICYKLNSKVDVTLAYERVDCSLAGNTMSLCSSVNATACPASEYGVGGECLDLDKCSLDPCHEHADCVVKENGDVNCTCSEDYPKGDGINFCLATGTCLKKSDCHEFADCNDTQCICYPGYEGDGWMCTNIDECDESVVDLYCSDNSKCTDRQPDDGMFECECFKGFEGDAKVVPDGCRPLPRNCSDALNKESISPKDDEFEKAKVFVNIADDDADEVQFEELEIECNQDPVTVVPSVSTICTNLTSGFHSAIFAKDDIHLKAARKVVENPAYKCMQRIHVCCSEEANLATSIKYKGYNGAESRNFGGPDEGQCPLSQGDPDECTEAEPEQTECQCSPSGHNFFWVTDEDMLPIVEVFVDGSAISSGQSMGVAIEDLVCVPESVWVDNTAMYRSCEDALEDNDMIPAAYLLETSTGETYYAFCYESNKAIVTQLSPKQLAPETSGECTTNSLEYYASMEAMRELIDSSDACLQHVSFSCDNNPIFDEKQNVFYTDASGADQTSFGTPDSSGVFSESCPCGVTGNCKDPSLKCNCDAGGSSQDGGYVTNKSLLPITAVKNCGKSPDGSSFDVGVLFCHSKRHLRVPASCHHYAQLDYLQSGTYLISTAFDAKAQASGGLEECLVYCDMHEKDDVIFGETVLPANKVGDTVITKGQVEVNYEYKSIHNCKMDKLTSGMNGNAYVVQKIYATCPKKWASASPAPVMKLFNVEGREITGCSCDVRTACEDPNGVVTCSCSAHGEDGAQFTGSPIASIVVTQEDIKESSAYDISVGSAYIREVGKDCVDELNDEKARNPETILECANNHTYTQPRNHHIIDPDGPGNERPFAVRCFSGITLIDADIAISPDSPCLDVTYAREVNPIQLRALAEVSAQCCQGYSTKGDQCASVYPMMADGTTQTYTFYNASGSAIDGYPGELGNSDKVCGADGLCKAVSTESCDQKNLEDFNNVMVVEDNVFLSKICSNDPDVPIEKCLWQFTNTRGAMRTSFRCSRRNICTGRNCYESMMFNHKQEYKRRPTFRTFRDWEGYTSSSVQIVDPDKEGEGEPCLVYCKVGPVANSQTVLPVVQDKNGEFDYCDSLDCFTDIVDDSTYCYQDIAVCGGEPADQITISGFPDNSSTIQFTIDGDLDATQIIRLDSCDPEFKVNAICCEGEQQAAYFRIVSKDFLPAKGYTSTSSSASVTFDGTVCSNLEKTCVKIHENQKEDLYRRFLPDGTYAVDPDGAGPLEPMQVYCDFKGNKEKYKGITYIYGDKDWDDEPYDLANDTNSTYPDQVNGVAAASLYCEQLVEYECSSNAALGLDTDISTGRAQFDLYSHQDGAFGPAAERFGYDFVGCACSGINSCLNNTDICNCDLGGAGSDGGYFFNKEDLPVLYVQGPAQGSYRTRVHRMRCSDHLHYGRTCNNLPKSLDSREDVVLLKHELVGPVHCKWNDDNDKEAILEVFLDKETDPDNDREVKETFECGANSSDLVLNISYAGLDEYELTKIFESHTCYQYVRFCSDSLGVTDSLKWYTSFGSSNGPFNVWGGKKSGCQCSRTKQCHDPKDKCNTDVLDDLDTDDMICDGGYIDYRSWRSTLHFLTSVVVKADPSLDSCHSNITVGPIFCRYAGKKPSINECERGLDDCFPRNRSYCTEANEGFECTCFEKTARGNGRNCEDFDECAAGLPHHNCNKHAECTNLDPLWSCSCDTGFAGPGSDSAPNRDDGCHDVDECNEDPDDPNGPCGKNGICYNTYGSYACVCPYGYSGNAYIECQPQCQCHIWGDPHFVTCDGKLHHYMGNCEHMLMGSCGNSNESFPFAVYGTNELDHPETDGSNLGYTSSMREMRVEWMMNDPDYATEFVLKKDVIVSGNPKKMVYVNGYKTQPHSIRQKYYTIDQELDDVVIRLLSNFKIPVVTISWDGINKGKIELPKSYVDSLSNGLPDGEIICGLCGNYDGDANNDVPSDETDVYELFGEFRTNKSDPECLKEPPGGSPCDEASQAAAEDACSSIKDSFEDCKVLVPDWTQFYESCIIDYCKLDSHCETIDKYFSLCLAAAGPELTKKLTSITFCELECEPGFEVKNCTIDSVRNSCDLQCGVERPDEECAAELCVPVCVCANGLYRDGTKCVEKSECGCVLEGMGYYQVDEFYINDNCTSNCTCQFTGFDCADNLKCDLEIATCGYDAEGTQTHTCYCNDGYRLQQVDGVWQCVDIDECEEDLDRCQTNSTCANTIGTYVCNCTEDGWRDSVSEVDEHGALTCDDIDECEEGTEDCDTSRPDSTCVNYPGAYFCQCNEGYVLNGFEQCSDVNECTSPQAEMKCQRDTGSECLNEVGSYTCYCEPGYRPVVEDNSTCEDIPFCKEELDDCHEDAACKDSTPSYTCTCNVGFQDIPYSAGRNCTDVDECLAKPSVCDVNAECNNTYGSYSCSCDYGWTGTGFPRECDDVDECSEDDVIVHDCHENATCADTDGSYTCTCNKGYSGTGQQCDNVDECTADDPLNPHNCNLTRSTCNDTVGYFFCDCLPGYEGTPCDDVDECTPELRQENCPGHTSDTSRNATCNNNDGSYTCDCYSGYTSSLNSEGLVICTNIDECEEGLDNCGDQTACSDTTGSFVCTCVTGYKPAGGIPFSPTLSEFNCENIDECSETDDGGSPLNNCDPISGVCSDNDGSFSCSCKDGFEGDGVNCKNIDECAIGDYFCEPRSYCKDTFGSYTCLCTAGNVMSSNDEGVAICIPKKCVDKVCDKDDYSCDFIPDMEGVNCTCALEKGCDGNNQGCDQDSAYMEPIDDENFMCICEDGYEMADNGLCTDVDECAREMHNCSAQAVCKNLEPFFDCVCDVGYEGDGFDCSDINECFVEDYNCGDKEYCSNTMGSYACKCSDGYRTSPNTGDCEDVNECSENIDTCNEVVESCENTDGSFTCGCKDGFAMSEDSNECEDINECTPEGLSCVFENAVCHNTFGSYECSCAKGYKLSEDGSECEDKNECQEGAYDCAYLEQCINKPGGYDCDCIEGYVKVDETCQDLDECQADLDDCLAREKCVNTPGGYECVCENGFERNMFFKDCVDIDECRDPDSCDLPGFKCVNTLGSYSCECLNEGFEPLGASCVDIKECLLEPSACDENAVCEDTEGSYTCTCKEGYRGNGKPGKCSDVNECAESLDECLPNAQCVNSEGSYYCTCDSGFIAHCHICLDINECEQGESPCSENGFCANAQGGFTCDCDPGFELLGKTQCEDIDECSAGTHGCPQKSFCKNTPGSFSCECDHGFQMEAGVCTDIDECSTYAAACPYLNAKCKNDDGGFTCECQSGYSLNLTSGKCEDDNECKLFTHDCSGSGSECLNTEGSFECVCISGFEENEDGQCVSIDDCVDNDCPLHSLCVDEINGYKCPCKPNHMKLIGTDGSVICKPRNPCDNLSRCNPGECVPLLENPETGIYSYFCICPEGYETENGGTPQEGCTTSDPCKRNECKFADCEAVYDEDNARNYTCMCFDGFDYVDDESLECEDIDECDEEQQFDHGCDEDTEKCYNTVGSYFCACKEGSQRVEGVCVANCDPSNCGDTERCVLEQKDDGTTEETCICKYGYRRLNETYCQDVDECEEDLYICANNATCVNTEGTYECECVEGTRSPDAHRIDCRNINECADEIADCPPNSYCEDRSIPLGDSEPYVCPCIRGHSKVNGSCILSDWEATCWLDDEGNVCGNGSCVEKTYSEYCECPVGYILDLSIKACTVSNECESNGWCHKDAYCKAEPDGVKCVCKEGYEASGSACLATDKCASGQDTCSENAHCIPTVDGAYECVCKDGFEGTGFYCEDKDECKLPELNGCTQNSKCVNTIGGYFCVCFHGYQNLGPGCVDKNECAHEEDNLCDEHADCINIDGGYTCVCEDGYDGDGYTCKDIDECFEEKHRCSLEGGVCTNEIGSYSCACDANEGYSGDGYQCSKLEPICGDGCQENADCIIENEGTLCKCEDGYLLSTEDRCDEINECQQELICNTQTCTNVDGSFVCSCTAGNVIVEGVCVDEDECEDDNTCPVESQTCANVAVVGPNDPGYNCFCTDLDCFEEFCETQKDGDGNAPPACDKTGVCSENADAVPQDYTEYKCVCKEGYDGDGITCEDIDECNLNWDDCGEREGCENTEGSFRCVCLSGYCVGDGSGCGGGEGEECAEGAGCSKAPGQVTPVCTCEEGYVGNGYEECEEEDPCDELTDCPSASTCEVVEGEATCACLEGMEGPQCDNPVDMCDPAYGGDDRCTFTGGQCVSLPEGGYQCQCADGFEGHGLSCVDLDECEDINRVGDACLGDCVNTVGGFSCPACEEDPGLTDKCEDIDECADNSDNCNGPNEECRNTDGSFACVCKEGFERPTADADCQACDLEGCCSARLPSCDVTDPCSNDDTNYCNSDTSSCEPTADSYTCECKDGFENDPENPLLCVDVDECSDQVADDCDEHARCVNAVGGYYCLCQTGYIGDGRTCKDINECEMQNLCDERAECTNLDGSYQCTCAAGLTKAVNFASCQDVNECASDNECDGATTTCVNTDGSYRCICNVGYSKLDASGTFCQDIDECANPDDNTCSPFEKCINEPGSYSCACAEGFESVGAGCKDVNECALGDVCGYDKPCENTPGGYKCDCGYDLKYNGSQCVPVDNCQQKWHSTFDHNCPFMSECKEEEIGFSCECMDNFQMVDGKCEDIDECTDPNAEGCGDDEICVNIYGGHECYCKQGYTKTASGSCEDINECSLVGLCVGSGSVCSNTIGSFDCSCKSGFQRVVEGDSIVCEDLDECEAPVDVCEDVEGSVCVNIVISEHFIPRDVPSSPLELSSPANSFSVSMQSVIDRGTNLPEATNQCFTGSAGSPVRMSLLDGTMFVTTVKVLNQIEAAGSEQLSSGAEVSVCGSSGSCQRCGYVENVFGDKQWDTVECYAVGSSVEIKQDAKTLLLCGVQVLGLELATEGYDCRCEAGYEKKKDPITGLYSCLNIDECESPLACDDNALCSDTEGNYTCECKHGYTGNGKFCHALCSKTTCGAYKTCEITPDNKPACVCRVSPSLQERNAGKFCGTDGNVYNSASEMLRKTCDLGLSVQIDYFGPCQDDCSKVECLGGSVCHFNAAHGRPTCKCNVTCDDTVNEPVCGSDGHTYPNECLLDKTICALKHDVTDSKSLKKVMDGECPEHCIVSSWSEWGVCRAEGGDEEELDCGLGRTSRTRSVTRYPNANGKTCPPTVETNYCHLAPCEGDPCFEKLCDEEYHVCLSETMQCGCPTCTHYNPNPVCGDAGTQFDNECQLRRAACLNLANDTAVQYPGECSEDENKKNVDPIECTLVSVEVSESTPTDLLEGFGAVSGVRTYKSRECKGGCLNLNHCCIPVQTFSKQVEVTDEIFLPGLTATTAKHAFEEMSLPTACACVKEEEQ